MYSTFYFYFKRSGSIHAIDRRITGENYFIKRFEVITTNIFRFALFSIFKRQAHTVCHFRAWFTLHISFLKHKPGISLWWVQVKELQSFFLKKSLGWFIISFVYTCTSLFSSRSFQRFWKSRRTWGILVAPLLQIPYYTLPSDLT